MTDQTTDVARLTAERDYWKGRVEFAWQQVDHYANELIVARVNHPRQIAAARADERERVVEAVETVLIENRRFTTDQGWLWDRVHDAIKTIKTGKPPVKEEE